MNFTLTTTVTTVVVDMKNERYHSKETYTLGPYQIKKDVEQKTMREYFDYFVRMNLPEDQHLLDTCYLFINPGIGVRKLTDAELRRSVQQFAEPVRLTSFDVESFSFIVKATAAVNLNYPY